MLPLRFEPYLRPMPWGARGLSEHLNKNLPTDHAFGEAWEVSDHPVHRSVVADGPLAGTSLRQLMETRKADLLGAAAGQHSVFPWLIKFLDCRDWLSVQVHPDTQVVQQLRPGEGSKTEAWFILKTEPGGRVYAGLKSGVTESDMCAAVARETTQELLHSFEPKAGDCVFLPAGTVHAVGGGVLMAEIQETSDVTFRLFDWNRVDAAGKRRDLHIEESFQSIHWDKGPVTPKNVSALTTATSLVRCPFFTLDYRPLTARAPMGGDGMHTLIVVEGSGTWEDGREVTPGHSWVLPAAMPAQTLTPNGVLKILDATLA